MTTILHTLILDAVKGVSPCAGKFLQSREQIVGAREAVS
jgi:hypothetical protein